jgi:cytochrome-b5 reductase
MYSPFFFLCALFRYLDDHPGGKEVMMDLAGKNADEMFEDIGHSQEARKIMKTFLKGDLKVL